MVLKYLPLLRGQRYMVSRAAGEGNGGGCESSSSGDGNEKKRRRQPYRIAAWTTERGENSCGRLLALACAAYCRGREEGYLTLPISWCAWERIGLGEVRRARQGWCKWT